MNYQITLYGNRIYKEIKLTDSFESVTIGTYKECQVSLKREYFLTDFKIEIRKQDDSYIALCNEEICLKSGTGNNLGQLRCQMTTEKIVTVCYSASDVPFLYIDFSMDFGAFQDNYDLGVSIPSDKKIVIGGVSGADIYVGEQMASGDYITLVHNSNGTYTVNLEKIGHGVAVNGVPVRKKEITVAEKKFLAFYNIIFYLEFRPISR